MKFHKYVPRLPTERLLVGALLFVFSCGGSVQPTDASPSAARPSQPEAETHRDVNVGECAFVRNVTTALNTPGGAPSRALPAGSTVRVLDRSDEWVHVALLPTEELHQCHREGVSPVGWVQDGIFFDVAIIATNLRHDLPPELVQAGFRFQNNVVHAFGYSVELSAPPEDGTFSVLRSGNSRYPYLFHAPSWEMGTGELVLVGPEGLKALSSVIDARYEIVGVHEEGLILGTEHLCLDLRTLLPLDQLLETGRWPTRLLVLSVRFHQDPVARDTTSVWTNAREEDARSLSFVEPGRGHSTDLQEEVDIPSGATFRAVSVVLFFSDDEQTFESYLEIRLDSDGRVILLDHSQIWTTNLAAFCAG